MSCSAEILGFLSSLGQFLFIPIPSWYCKVRCHSQWLRFLTIHRRFSSSGTQEMLLGFPGGAGQGSPSQNTCREMVLCFPTLPPNGLRLWLPCFCKDVETSAWSLEDPRLHLLAVWLSFHFAPVGFGTCSFLSPWKFSFFWFELNYALHKSFLFCFIQHF